MILSTLGWIHLNDVKSKGKEKEVLIWSMFTKFNYFLVVMFAFCIE